MRKFILAGLVTVYGLLLAACGSGDNPLTTQITSFKATNVATGIDLKSTDTFPAGTDVKFSWHVNSPTSNYTTILSVSSTTSPGNLLLTLPTRTSSSADDSVICRTDNTTVQAVTTTTMTCTGLAVPIPVTSLLGAKPYIVLQAYGVSASTDTKAIQINL